MRRLVLSTTCGFALLVAGCSQSPEAPAESTTTRTEEVELAGQLDQDQSGTIRQEIKAGTSEEVDLRLPSEEGRCTDFSEVELPSEVEGALDGSGSLERVHVNYDVQVDYVDGPALSGWMQARLYGTSEEAGDLWHERNRVGTPVTVNLDRGEARLTGAAVLNDEQLQALNDRNVCWGLAVRGRDVTAEEDGLAVFDYSVNRLKLTIEYRVAGGPS